MNPYSLKSISTTYPGFQSLPKGIKQMLLITENFYFEEARAPQPDPTEHEVPPEVLHLVNAGAAYQSAAPTQIRTGI